MLNMKLAPGATIELNDGLTGFHAKLSLVREHTVGRITLEMERLAPGERIAIHSADGTVRDICGPDPSRGQQGIDMQVGFNVPESTSIIRHGRGERVLPGRNLAGRVRGRMRMKV